MTGPASTIFELLPKLVINVCAYCADGWVTLEMSFNGEAPIYVFGGTLASRCCTSLDPAIWDSVDETMPASLAYSLLVRPAYTVNVMGYLYHSDDRVRSACAVPIEIKADVRVRIGL